MQQADRSQTALRLSQHPTLTPFLRSCIAHIGDNVGLVPHEAIPRALRGPPSGTRRGKSCGNSTGVSALTASDPLGRFLHQLLREQVQSTGTLTSTSGSMDEIKFRCNVLPGQPRPCSTARVWRPSQAEHKSNGAWVSIIHHGEVSLICLHPQCLHRGCSNRRLLGYIPLSLLRLSSSTDEITNSVTFRSSEKESRQKRVQRVQQYVVCHDSPESLESSVSPHMPTELEHCQSANDGHDEQSFPASSDTPRDKQTRSLSREQSFARVAAENQHATIEPFQAWVVETGQFQKTEIIKN